MSAREIIATFLALRDESITAEDASKGERLDSSDAILLALTAAGYRIVGPGELDAATVERCAQIARDAHVSHRPGGLDAYNCDIATALRNLQEGKP